MDGGAVDAVAGDVWGAVRWGVGGVGWRVGWGDVDVVDAGVDGLVVAEAILSVLHHFLFCYGRIVAVPRVPSHRRCLRPCAEGCHVVVCLSLHGGQRKQCGRDGHVYFFS